MIAVRHAPLYEGYALGVPSAVALRQVDILNGHDQHHAQHKGRPRELDNKQRPLPSAAAGSIAAEHLRHRDAGKQQGGQASAHHKQHTQRQQRRIEIGRSKQCAERYASQFLHPVAEKKSQQSSQQEGQQYDHRRLQQKQAEDTPTARAAALVHTDGLGPPRQRGDGDEHVVERRDQQQRDAQKSHDGHHPPHLGQAEVRVAQRSEVDGKLQSAVGRQVAGNVGRVAFVQPGGILRTAQAHVAVVVAPAVPSLPPLRIPADGGKGNHGLGTLLKGSVRRYVAEDALDEQRHLVALNVVAHRLAKGTPVAKQAARTRLGEEDRIGAGQVLRISLQHVQPQDGEEQGVAHQGGELHLPFAQAVAVTEERAADGASLHTVGVQGSYRAGDGHQGVDRLLPLRQAVLQPACLHLIEPVGLVVEVVVTQFESDSREEKHRHQQPQGQRNNLDQVCAGLMGQSL